MSWRNKKKRFVNRIVHLVLFYLEMAVWALGCISCTVIYSLILNSTMGVAGEEEEKKTKPRVRRRKLKQKKNGKTETRTGFYP